MSLFIEVLPAIIYDNSLENLNIILITLKYITYSKLFLKKNTLF